MSEHDNRLIYQKNTATKPVFLALTRLVQILAGPFIDDLNRQILWIPVFIGFGIGIYFSLPEEPSLYIGIVGSTVFLPSILLFRRKTGLFQLSILLFAVFLGHLAAQIRTLDVDHVVLAKETGPTRVIGKVVRVEPKTNGVRLLLESVMVRGLEPFDTPETVRITARMDRQDRIVPGDWVTLRAVLRPPSPPVSPGAFDFQRYAFFHGIGATGYAFGPPEIKRKWNEDNASERLATWLGRFRLSIGERVRDTLPGETGALAAALITGERLAIPEDTVTAMRHAGLAHLLAISGLHIGLVAGLVFFVIRAGLALIPALALRYPIKTWAALAALAAAFFYTLLAGATIPTMRSFLMMALILGAVMLGRRAISMRSVALAATIVLLFLPESLLGPSFQLSFAAVVALVAVYEWISLRLPAFWRKGAWHQRLFRYLGGVLLSTLVAGLATAPFAAYHFHHLASYGLVANIVAIPLTGLIIMPAALLAMALMPFGLEHIALYFMGIGVENLILTAHTVATLPGNLQTFPAMPLAALVMIALGGPWLCLWQREWRYFGLFACLVGLLTIMQTEQPVVLASENSEIFGLRTSHGFYLVGPGTNANRYTRNEWLERAGHRPGRGSGVNPANQKAVRCDHMGCVVVLENGKKLSVLWDEGALLEDCWEMDVVISAVPVRRRCDTPELVIDRFDLWRNGAYAIYSEEDGIRVENTREIRGNRPWIRSATNKRKRNAGSES